MEWVLLAVAAAVAGGIAIRRSGGRARRSLEPVAYSRRSRAERGEQPHRRLVHYRASGALPRWDS